MRIERAKRAILALCLPLLGCAGAYEEGLPNVTARVQPIADSKCGGGLAFLTIDVVNRGPAPMSARPQCISNSPGVEVVESPAVARLLAPGATGQFVCAVQDVGDPPDGQIEGAVARLVVRVGAAEQQLRLPVTCPR